MTLTEREYERRLRETLNRARLVVVQLDHHGNVIYCNPFTYTLLGFDKDELFEKNWFDACIPESRRNEVKEAFQNIMGSEGEIFSSYINPIVTKSGEERIIRWNNIILKDVAGNIIGTSSVGEDITDLQRANDQLTKINRIYAVTSAINQAIIHVSDREQLFKDICNMVINLGKFRMAWIGLIDEERRSICLHSFSGYEDGYLDNIKILLDDVPEGRGPTGTALRLKKVVICNDIATDPSMRPWRDAALKRGYRSSASLPFIMGGRPVGVLNLYSSEQNFFDKAEMLLLDELAGDVSFSLEAMENDKKRMAVEKELQDKVKELEKLNEIMMGREEKIIELKEEIKKMSR